MSSWVTVPIAGHAPRHERSSMAGSGRVFVLLRTSESDENVLCLYDYYL